MSTNLNFNNTGGQPFYEAVPVQEIRGKLLNQLPSVLQYLLPNGKIYKNNKQFLVGNIQGESGESLKVELNGPRVGLWQDFATSEGGDIFELWAKVKGLDAKNEFPRLMEEIKNWLGVYAPFKDSLKSVSSPTNKSATNDNFSKPSAEWSYVDLHGKVIAKKLRYDVNGEKSYLPWDEERKKYKMPKSRILYNLPGITKANKVILVEGEKCAQALIDKGICATTAMGGANTDINKTDWSPLKGKDIIIWPDNDTPGKEYAEKATNFLKTKSVKSVAILNIPADKAEKWDAADAIAEEIDIELFLESSDKKIIYSRKRIPIYKFKQYRNDNAPIAEDIVSPRILTPRGLFVLGGAPKVGKSDYLVGWMAHMAAGIPFLGMTPARPLKIFFLQTEIDYDYLKERIKMLTLDESLLKLIDENLSLTPKVDVLLNEQGVEELIEDIKDHFQNDAVDIIVIDPLYDVFDSNGSDLAENDNNLMNLFLKNRVEYLRDQINPQAGIIIVHHTRKITKAILEEDPFQALAGASSLRRRFTSGSILYRPDENQTPIKVIFELRNGPKIPNKLIDKIDNNWQELEHESVRLVHQEYGRKLDAERERRHDVILDIIDAQASKGRVFTMQQFCEVFENKKGLGGMKSIRARLDVLSTNGYIKFIKNGEGYDLKKPSGTKFGYLCVENMQLKTLKGEVIAYPSHYKCRETGASLEVENPKIWVYMGEQ